MNQTFEEGRKTHWSKFRDETNKDEDICQRLQNNDNKGKGQFGWGWGFDPVKIFNSSTVNKEKEKTDKV